MYKAILDQFEKECIGVQQAPSKNFKELRARRTNSIYTFLAKVITDPTERKRLDDLIEIAD